MASVTLEHVTKRFGGLTAVDDVSFSVREGEIYTIIGPNGAGKTTIFNLVSLIYSASAGRIVYRGEDLTGDRKSTRLNSSHSQQSRMPSSA